MGAKAAHWSIILATRGTGVLKCVVLVLFFYSSHDSVLLGRFCECEVKFVKKAPSCDGYIVYFAWHGSKRRKFGRIFEQDLMWVHAKNFVFLGAGTLGTTEILLRSKQRGLSMSNAVGTRMSCNGDMFAFAYNTDVEVNAAAREHPDPARPVGPTITGVIDCREQENALDGFVLQEGVIPRALVPGIQLMLESMPGKIYPSNGSAYQQFIRRMLSKVFGPYHFGGSVQRTQVYLIMSHDSNQANLVLNEDGKPLMRWRGIGRSKHVAQLNNLMAKATNAINGTFVNNPFFAALGEQQVSRVASINLSMKSLNDLHRLEVIPLVGQI